MKTSTDRILTTHTGSLPRPADLTDRHDEQAVRAAVQETVRRQLDAGVDIVNDGEVSKPSYAGYVTERLTGFTGEPIPFMMRDFEAFPEFAQKMWGDPAWRRSWPIRAATGQSPTATCPWSRPTSPTCAPPPTERPTCSCRPPRPA